MNPDGGSGRDRGGAGPWKSAPAALILDSPLSGGRARLHELLDQITALRSDGDLEPQRSVRAEPTEPTATAVAYLMAAPHLRREHRQRIYLDIAENRDLILKRRDPRLLDLIHWSEHVESLYASVRGGALQTFHYARALEATCRRCDFDLLPAMGRMEELGKHWAAREYEKVLAIFASEVPEDPTPEDAAQPTS